MSDQPAPKRKTGRPSTFSLAAGMQVCDAIASGATLEKAAEQAHVKPTTFLNWCDRNAELADEYARARQRQNEAIDDELRALVAATNADNSRAMETKFRMLTWIAGKRAPKKFGERLGLEHSGEIAIDRAAEIAQLREALRAKK